MPWLTHFLALIDALVADRSRLALENGALRQQVVVLKRSVSRAKFEDSDRVLWILMRRLLDSWRETLLIVKAETVIQWHRKGQKLFSLAEFPEYPRSILGIMSVWSCKP
jgi:hypothetical protein